MRALRFLFVATALACAGTAVWHALQAIEPRADDASSPARHAVFVVVNALCAAGFVARPRFFPFAFVLLAAQQIVSHGGDAVRAVVVDHAAPAPVDVTVALAMPILAALLFVDRRLRATHR